MTGRRFVVVLVADTDRDPDAAIRQLRALLKHAGRCYRLRCESAKELTDTTKGEKDDEPRR